ncbi:hypothetical protein NDU88_003129 [Pleurodeles waltl]|uniref:Uncharacterized protein n=1 Tax=Pleurodeles waltl TaxID=8319 RepID=A0AAV7MTD9_PLEWA|nr:hypothetical protein NDU88_003129 [Pleurodeles waltl]
MPPDLLADPACRDTITGALGDYLEINWHSATTKALGWEALKAVMCEACLGVTYGVWRQLELNLGAQKHRLAVLQGSGETSQELRQKMLQVRTLNGDLAANRQDVLEVFVEHLRVVYSAGVAGPPEWIGGYLGGVGLPKLVPELVQELETEIDMEELRVAI